MGPWRTGEDLRVMRRSTVTEIPHTFSGKISK
jgi:hypothetical protein